MQLDQALLNLERWLQYQHHLQGWDVEKVEVKGRPPIFEWGVEKYELKNVRLGTLAKVPVEALDRPEELMATTSVSVALPQSPRAGSPEGLGEKGYNMFYL